MYYKSPKYVNPEGSICSEEALQGAQDIIAEMAADDAEIRGTVRTLIRQKGVLRSQKS